MHLITSVHNLLDSLNLAAQNMHLKYFGFAKYTNAHSSNYVLAAEKNALVR